MSKKNKGYGFAMSKETPLTGHVLPWQESPHDVAVLTLMHSYRRPHDTKGEREFTKAFLDCIPGMTKDSFGNRMISIGDSKVMFSSHVDTVHSKGGRQKVAISAGGIMTLAGNSDSNCLGADDTAGVWLMIEMIKARVPGLYIFHRGEECGGLGSTHIAATTPELLDGITHCIALDRKGYDSVITHQYYMTASDAFADDMASRLGGDFAPDDSGLFTDSANYEHLIPECTNLSVGYFRQHGPSESLNIGFLLWLRDRCMAIDWESLTAERIPGDTGSSFDFRYKLDSPKGSKGYGNYSGVDSAYSVYESYYGDQRDGDYRDPIDVLEDRRTFALDRMTALCASYPDVAARLLWDCGQDSSDIAEAIYDQTGELITNK